MTQAGVLRNALTHSSAASASAMLLYESSLPASTRAAATVPAGTCVLDVERAALVRILAIAQRLLELERKMQRRRERFDALAVRPRAEPVRDDAVVARGVRIGLGREPATQRQASCRRARALRGSRRNRSDRRRRRRARGSSPPRAASPGRRHRCSRSRRRACSPAARWPIRTDRGSRSADRSARCHARAITASSVPRRPSRPP